MPTASLPFLIYLDSKDLIDVERGGIDAELLPQLFSNADATLVLSSTVIDEVIEPLRHREGGSVMRLMNILEATPHCWLRTVDLERLELSTAADGLSAGQTPIRCVPFCSSYLDTGFVDDGTKSYYRGKALAAIMWDQVYGERISSPTARLADHFAEVIRTDRQIIATLKQKEYRKKLRQKFDQKVQSVLGDGRINQGLLDALWMNPDCCPTARLDFEAYHMLVRDRRTLPTVNDVNDFTRLMAVPYVDVFTADGAKWDLLRRLQARPELSEMEHWNRVKILRNSHEVFALLEEKAGRLTDENMAELKRLAADK